jgi:putative transposase
VAVLKQAEAGMSVGRLIRHVNISEQTFYRWKKVYTGLQTEQGATAETASGRKCLVEEAGRRADTGQGHADRPEKK